MKLEGHPTEHMLFLDKPVRHYLCGAAMLQRLDSLLFFTVDRIFGLRGGPLIRRPSCPVDRQRVVRLHTGFPMTACVAGDTAEP